MERLSFYDIFQPITGDQLTPIKVVRIGGITFGPGITFSKGVSFGGVNLFDYKGKDLAVERDDNVLVIKGAYTD